MNIVEDNLHRGDVVLLQPGDLVPADLRLFEATGLEVDEFELRGEIMPVIKKVNGNDAIAFKGSKVIRGTGKGYVIATGEQTEYGKYSKQVWEQEKGYEFHWVNKLLNLIQSNKLAAGQTIPHFHLHIVPRYKDDHVVLRFGHGRTSHAILPKA